MREKQKILCGIRGGKCQARGFKVQKRGEEKGSKAATYVVGKTWRSWDNRWGAVGIP